jgi:hypothetical protein
MHCSIADDIQFLSSGHDANVIEGKGGARLQQVFCNSLQAKNRSFFSGSQQS